MNACIIAELKKEIEAELLSAGEDWGQVEQVVAAEVHRIGQALMQAVVGEGKKGYQGSSLHCPDCGGARRFVGYRNKTVLTRFGTVTVRRAYYHCPTCQAGTCPYDGQAGLGPEHLSPGLARICSLLAVDDSFEESARKVREITGQSVTDDLIERVVHRVGQVILDRQSEAVGTYFQTHEPPAAQREPARLYITADGTTVHEEDGWHEAKVGCLYWESGGWKPEKRYLGGLISSGDFGWRLWLESCRCGYRQTPEPVFLGDGSGWLRTEHDRHFRRAVFIIDWFHGSEHVWTCGKVLFGEGTRVTAQWVKKRRAWLWKGKIERLLWDLEVQARAACGASREALAGLIRYLRTNKDSMRYDVFRQQGYDIGSGAVEGACKHVVGKRLKGSGMVWSRKGSSTTLALRLAWLNHEWEAVWRWKPLAA
jgi:hypothetical protein